MKILVIGSGGREHAICLKLRQSPLVTQLFCAPGNPGISGVATIVPHAATELQALAAFAKANRVDLTVIGPEQPLALGIADLFSEQGLAVVGPRKAAAAMEVSKHFAKEIMAAAGVPTARYQVFSDQERSREFLKANPGRWVLKADGLAAGKGVVVCESQEQVLAALPEVWSVPDTNKVVIEEFLEGVEASFIVASNGTAAVPLLAAHDYKRIGEGDKGPNTGGMGTVCPTPRLTPKQQEWALTNVAMPVLRVLASRGTPFCGFLFAGLMIGVDGAIKVLEFNARLGDPETQSILALLESDLVELLLEMADPTRGAFTALRWRAGAAVCVVNAADGYPAAPQLGDPIEGLEFAASLPGVQVLHAGTKVDERRRIVTSGGRVLNVIGRGESREEARRTAFRAADMIQFRGKQMRRDIGA